MTQEEWPEVASLIESLWPRFAGVAANGTTKFHPEYQAAVLAKLDRFFLPEVLGAFRTHRQDMLDEYKPKFDVVIAALKGRSPQTKERRDEDGRTDAERVAHLKREREAGLQVLDEEGEEAVNEAWDRILESAAAEARANSNCVPYLDALRRNGPRWLPTLTAQAVNHYRFDEIMAGC